MDETEENIIQMASFLREDDKQSHSAADKIKKGRDRDITAQIVGDFGKWQCRISLLMSLLKIPLAWYQLNIIFMAPPQDFWCVKPAAFWKYSNQEWRKMSIPIMEEHPCYIFDPDMLIIDPPVDKAFIPLVQCKNFTYDQCVFKNTISMEWNLVCTKRWLVHLTQCIMMWGMLIGGNLYGILADKYGRKKILMICIVQQAVGSLLSSVMPVYSLFIVSWFALALATGGLGVISFVICMEVVSGKWRTSVPVLYQLPFGFGNAVMAGLAYWLRDWRKLELALGALSSLFILYWFCIPESPRWLIATGRTDEALVILRDAAKLNKRKVSDDEIKHLLKQTQSVHESPGFMAFLRSRNMRIKTLLLCINWFFMGLSFYTFSQYLGAIGGNIFVVVAMSGIIGTPGGILCVYVITRLDRKTTVWLFQTVTAVCFLGLLLIQKNIVCSSLRMIFAGAGFAGLAGVVPSMYLYTGELYPTVGRNAGIGGVSTFARIGSMIAPAVCGLNDLVPDLPIFLCTVISFGQILLLVPLPETKDYPLPDTLEQAEQFQNSCRKKNVG